MEQPTSPPAHPPTCTGTLSAAQSLMGKAMNSLYCFTSAASFLSSAYSQASGLRCSVMRVPRSSSDPASSRTWRRVEGGAGGTGAT